MSILAIIKANRNVIVKRFLIGMAAVAGLTIAGKALFGGRHYEDENADDTNDDFTEIYTEE